MQRAARSGTPGAGENDALGAGRKEAPHGLPARAATASAIGGRGQARGCIGTLDRVAAVGQARPGSVHSGTEAGKRAFGAEAREGAPVRGDRKDRNLASRQGSMDRNLESRERARGTLEIGGVHQAPGDRGAYSGTLQSGSVHRDLTIWERACGKEVWKACNGGGQHAGRHPRRRSVRKCRAACMAKGGRRDVFTAHDTDISLDISKYIVEYEPLTVGEIVFQARTRYIAVRPS